MKTRLSIIAALLIVSMSVWPAAAFADTGDGNEYYTVYDESGVKLTCIGGRVYMGDIYISGQNAVYEVESVDDQTRSAIARFSGVQALSKTAYYDKYASVMSNKENRLIALYSTHSDESYIEGDGISSDEVYGGIYDVSDELKEKLNDMGIEVIIDYTTHHPHDAAAYTRSRSTAVSLLKNMPDAIFDIHRDGVPEDEYTTQVEGEDMTMVRLLVGRSNPNQSANKDFAASIKANADEMYPGLIKDIFIGKGNYNQELSPRSVLLEFGTHESDKDDVLKSTEYMAEVLSKTIYGTTQLSGTADEGLLNEGRPADESSKGAGSGIAWILGIVVGGGLLLLLFVNGSGGFFDKVRRTASELTGGIIGKKPDDKENGEK